MNSRLQIARVRLQIENVAARLSIGNLQFEMFFISPMPGNARGPR
jgi:hypothetical protein